MSRHLRAGECLPSRPGMQARPWNSERQRAWGVHSRVFIRSTISAPKAIYACAPFAARS
jgi:hypothetical protein